MDFLLDGTPGPKEMDLQQSLNAVVLQLLQNQVIFGARAAWEPKHEIFMKCSWQVMVGSLWILIMGRSQD